MSEIFETTHVDGNTFHVINYALLANEIASTLIDDSSFIKDYESQGYVLTVFVRSNYEIEDFSICSLDDESYEIEVKRDIIPQVHDRIKEIRDDIEKIELTKLSI